MSHPLERVDDLAVQAEITDADMARGGINDLRAYLQDFWKNEI